jgi:hypothetical protein
MTIDRPAHNDTAEFSVNTPTFVRRDPIVTARRIVFHASSTTRSASPKARGFAAGRRVRETTHENARKCTIYPLRLNCAAQLRLTDGTKPFKPIQSQRKTALPRRQNGNAPICPTDAATKQTHRLVVS